MQHTPKWVEVKGGGVLRWEGAGTAFAWPPLPHFQRFPISVFVAAAYANAWGMSPATAATPTPALQLIIQVLYFQLTSTVQRSSFK